MINTFQIQSKTKTGWALNFAKQTFICGFFMLFLTFNVSAQNWYAANNPYGGHVVSMHETQDGTLLCGTNQGLYKSSDNGENWEGISGEYMKFSTLDVKSTSSGMYISLFGYVLRRSYDGGQTWETLPAQDWTSLNKIIVNANDQIFLNTNNSVWRSSDDGDTWTQLEPGMNGNRFYAFELSPDGELYGSSYNKKMYRSDDNGDTWTELATFTGDISSMGFDGDNTVYATTRFNGIFKSTDNGETWTELTAIPGSNGGNEIKVNSSGDVFIGAYDDGIYKSSDGGTSWEDITNNLIDPTIRIIFFNSDEELFVGTRAGGVNLLDGTSWVQKNEGITAIFINRFLSFDEVLYACSNFGVFMSNDGGLTWQQSVQGMDDTEIVALAKAPNGDLYAGSEMLYRSEDGENWIDLSQGFPDSDVYATDLLVEADGRIIMATDDYGMCYSDNQGQTWTYANTGLEDVTMAFIRKSSGGFYFTADGYNLYRSNDLSSGWEIINDGLTDTDITEFTVGNGVLFAVTYSDGLFKSTDNGDTWTLSTEEEFNNVAVYGSEVYGSAGGVFFSDDNGINWSDITAGLPGDFVEEVTWVENMGLFAFVYGYGLYTLDFSVVGISDELIAENQLTGYPNPFTESISVRLDLHENAKVFYSIINLSGQIVDRSASFYLTKGTHTLQLGKDLQPGFYLLSINSNEVTSTVRIVKSN